MRNKSNLKQSSAAEVIAAAPEATTAYPETLHPQLDCRLGAYWVYQITKLMKPGDEIATAHPAMGSRFLYVAERDASLVLTYGRGVAILRRVGEQGDL